MSNNSPVIVFHPTDEIPTDKSEFRSMLSSLAEAATEKFFDGNQESAAKFALKTACNMLAGGAIAKSLGGLTPFRWILQGFGAMPSQFMTYRALPVLEFTKNMVPIQTFRGVGGFVGGNGARIMVAELSLTQRLFTVARVVGARFVFVTIAFQGGYLVGTLINDKVLDDSTKNVVGGMMNQIINEGGWRLAIPSVVRESLGVSTYNPTVDLSEM